MQESLPYATTAHSSHQLILPPYLIGDLVEQVVDCNVGLVGGKVLLDDPVYATLKQDVVVACNEANLNG